MTRRLNIGVVGLRFGADVHVPAFRNDSRCEVSGIAGRDPAKVAHVARRLGVLRPFDDWRALVHAPELVVLDDLSSAVDVETELLLWDNLSAAGLTVIAVSHRAVAFERADQILRLEGGRLVA